MQKSRFTASKPSIFAIASDEKFIRHLVTSFHQRSLSQSAYQNDPTKPNFGTLTATTYGNGAKVSSRYDDFNRVTGVVYGEKTAPRYEYDYNAKGQVARVRDNLLNRTTQSEYDFANRPVRVKTSEDAKHVYTGQVAYDNVYGNLSEFTEKVGENRQEYGTKFGYDDENRPTSLTYSASGKEIGQSTTTIDKLNRTTFSAVKLGSKTFTSEYHFAAGGYGTGSVTNLVSSITQPGCNCGYGYDDNGNIASATLNGKWTGYTYDALGQLIQVNDHSDTRSGENGTTWKYTYDLGGNILKKERFAYADTTNPLETVTYTYGDANWRDKLTAVNGSTIRYDAIGNPLNDGTWTYTWQNGRQLQKMQKAGVTAEFVYNADGLRVQKTVNGVATKYTLHGKNIVHMTSGDDELHFFYDAQNRPAVVVYNGTAYAYVKSLQGDIVAILDENGNAVVSYGYDAWGAPLWCTGELAETLGKVQPFRYRGYVFDEETGLYYLRSRYYSSILSRFICSDTLIEANTFAYCLNNPIIRVDEDGFVSWLVHMQQMALLHDEVVRRVANHVLGKTSRLYTRIPGAGRGGGNGYPDVMRGKLVWEIKPATTYGEISGRRQMAKYTNNTGYRAGYPVYLPCFEWSMGKTKGIVYVINGTAETGDAGVVYYNFVPRDEQEQEETVTESVVETVTAPTTAKVWTPAYTYTSANNTPRSEATGGLVFPAGICLLGGAMRYLLMKCGAEYQTCMQ